jgi:hypothetical protein
VLTPLGHDLPVATCSPPAGPTLDRFPPRLEIEEHDGTYVLLDVGPRAEWRYEFVPREA